MMKVRSLLHALLPLHVGLYVVLIILQLATLTTATITIAGTGERYASHPDRQVGTRWMEGYEYMARLQMIPHDLDLCGTDPSKNLTVTVPTDGLPVVLLTRGDDCSDTTKVQTALSRILPKGVVKYLIIYNGAVHPPLGRRSRRSLEAVTDQQEQSSSLLLFLDEQQQQEHEQESDHHTNMLMKTLAQQIAALSSDWSTTNANADADTDTDADADADTDADADADAESEEQKQQQQQVVRLAEQNWARLYHHDDYEHRMGVLHVTNKVGVALLRVMVNQPPQDKAYGGPRVLLDGNTASEGTFVRNLVFWIGISLMMAGCLCSFCLSIRLTESDIQHPAPTRPEQRRLTVDQVEEWFPDYILDDDDEKQREDDSATHVECSICLDDYKSGDYMKKLPCAHEFHADCIGKWLTERHATCPLCKLDLLPEEEEESDEEEEDEEASILDTADVDADENHHSVSQEEEANRTSIMQFLVGSLPWRWSTPVAAVAAAAAAAAAEPATTPTTPAIDEEAGVDPTPLLDDQHSL